MLHPVRISVGCLIAALALAVGGLAVPLPAAAHHGWEWAEKATSEVSGKITDARLGNPHGVLTLDVKGQSWLVEVGQPWRNERAGLKDQMLAKGVVLTIVGNKSTKKDDRKIKAVRVLIEGKTYNLYPERE